MVTKVVLMLIKYKDFATQEITEVRLTSAPHNVTYSDAEWIAAGDLLSIGEHESNYELITSGVEVRLSGINRALQPVIDKHGFRNAPVDILIGDLPEGSDEVTAASYYHRGFASTPVTEFDENSGTITVLFETQSAFKNLELTSHLMTTSMAHHQALHAGDRFFEYTADIGLGEEVWKD